jgi:hypothetical protein
MSIPEMAPIVIAGPHETAHAPSEGIAIAGFEGTAIIDEFGIAIAGGRGTAKPNINAGGNVCIAGDEGFATTGDFGVARVMDSSVGRIALAECGYFGLAVPQKRVTNRLR